MPFRATFDCLWCGDAYACRGPDDLEGWAQLCSSCVGKAGDNGFLRFRLHQALTERGAARPRRCSAVGRDRRCRPPWRRPTAGQRDAADPGRDGRSRCRDARLLRGPRPGIRRLVPASRPVRARPRPRRRLERRARCGRALARRPADPRRDRGARGRHRLVVAAARRQGRAVALRRGIGPARSGAGATGRASPARAPARARRVGRAGSGGRRALHRVLAEPRAARPARRVPGASSGAGSSPAGSSRSSTPARIRSRARSTTRHPPTTPPSAASTTAASSRSSRSTTSRPSWRPRSPEPGSTDAAVTTTGRFFLTGSARARET